MWARITTARQTAEPTRYPYATMKPRFTVESCCHEEHAWWIVAGSTFLSTWKSEDEAVAECRRLNELNLSVSEATR